MNKESFNLHAGFGSSIGTPKCMKDVKISFGVFLLGVLHKQVNVWNMIHKRIHELSSVWRRNRDKRFIFSLDAMCPERLLLVVDKDYVWIKSKWKDWRILRSGCWVLAKF